MFPSVQSSKAVAPALTLEIKWGINLQAFLKYFEE